MRALLLSGVAAREVTLIDGLLDGLTIQTGLSGFMFVDPSAPYRARRMPKLGWPLYFVMNGERSGLTGKTIAYARPQMMRCVECSAFCRRGGPCPMCGAVAS